MTNEIDLAASPHEQTDTTDQKNQKHCPPLSYQLELPITKIEPMLLILILILILGTRAFSLNKEVNPLALVWLS